MKCRSEELAAVTIISKKEWLSWNLPIHSSANVV